MKKQSYSFEKLLTFPYMGAGIFLIALVIFWTKIVSLFKPVGYEAETQKPISSLNNMFLSRHWINKEGYFLTAQGVKTKYALAGANAHALQLAGDMDTSKRDSWYERIFSLSVSPAAYRVKAILNKNYPSSYRRYVIQAYADIYTNGRDLQTDARKQLISMAWFGDWNENLTAYFKL